MTGIRKGASRPDDSVSPACTTATNAAANSGSQSAPSLSAARFKRCGVHETDHRHRRLLPARRERPRDRLFLIQLYRWFPSVLKAITIVRPETLVRWHRAGFRRYWRWKSRSLGGRPQIDTDLRALIRRISAENPLWGAPRIPWRAAQARLRGRSVLRRLSRASIIGLPTQGRADGAARRAMIRYPLACDDFDAVMGQTYEV